MRMALFRLLQRLLPCSFAIGLGAMLPSPAVAQDGLFDFADLINDALESLTEPEEEVVVEAFEVMEFANGPQMAASALKERNARLEAYSGCVTNWALAQLELSDADKAAFLAAVQQQVTQAIAAKAEQNRDNLPAHMALKFTEPGAIAARIDALLSRKKMAELPLSPEDQKTLLQALEARNQHLQQANTGQVVNLIDGQFFMTDDQREALASAIPNRIDVSRPCFSFHPQTYYFKQQALTPVVSASEVAGLWSPAQKARATSLKSVSNNGNNGQYLMFQSQGGTDDWEEQLMDHMKEQTEQMLTAMEVQVDYIRRLSSLSDQDAFYLRVAAKGAVDGVLTTWKRTTQQQLDRNRQAFEGRMGNFAFSIQTPQVEATQQNEIWKTTLTELSPDHQKLAKQRMEQVKDATAAYMVGMLDRELWLTDEQRESLFQSVRKEVPLERHGLMNQEYFRALSYFCVPLFKLSKEDLKVLSPEQKKAYALLKKPFSLNGQYVQFQSEHGQMMFEMMGARQNQRGGVGLGFF